MSLAEALRRGHGAATLYTFVFVGLGSATFLVALLGLLLGVAPGFFAARAVVPLEPSPLTYGVAPVLLVVTSVLALWAPTRRAARADPMDALREG